MTLMRSLLFVPGNRADMLEKALALRPDAYVPDMEDSIPPDEKVSARETVSSALPGLAGVGPPVIARVNRLDSGLIEDDIAAVVGADIYGVSIGKVGSAADIREIGDILVGVEQKTGLAPESVRLVPWVETAMGVQNVYEICTASPRVVAVAFGGEDFTADMGIERTEAGHETDYARSAVCIAARAAGVVALDTPYVKFRDTDGLRRDCIEARGRGFTGKFAIHPSQIEVINQVFSPSESEIEEAQRVIQAYEKAERDGRGALALDGKMVDEPVVARARGVLEQAARVSDNGQE